MSCKNGHDQNTKKCNVVIDFQSVSFSYCECNDFFTIKKGIPTDEELEKLSVDIGEAWKSLGRGLKIDETPLTGFDRENDEYREKYRENAVALEEQTSWSCNLPNT